MSNRLKIFKINRKIVGAIALGAVVFALLIGGGVAAVLKFSPSPESTNPSWAPQASPSSSVQPSTAPVLTPSPKPAPAASGINGAGNSSRCVGLNLSLMQTYSNTLGDDSSKAISYEQSLLANNDPNWAKDVADYKSSMNLGLRQEYNNDIALMEAAGCSPAGISIMQVQ